MDNTILVVEDDPELQEVLALNLQNAGYRVLRAGTTRQAEALMNATVPQLLLLDWMLPDTPGLSFARKLRSEPRTMAIPIISVNGRRLMLCAPRRRCAIASDVFAVLDTDRVLQRGDQDRAVAGVPGLCRAGDDSCPR